METKDGGEPWAQSDGFNVDAKDVIVLVSAIGSGNFEPVYNGVHINGNKYMYLRGDAETISFKRQNCGGVAMVTDKAVLIGMYEDGMQGPCHNTVGKLADYLRTQEF